MHIYPPGTRLGKYEIASRPMMGGMGVVYFAIDHGNDRRPVALKTFRPEFLPDRAARDRFLREGTAWIELGNHPHIVRCYKVEYIDPTAFLVLELIAKDQNMPDASLRSWLIPGRPLPLEQALLFALQIARGMQHAIEKIPGFVHRDLKPENILVGADKLPGTNINRLRVTDFGLVKTIAGGDMPMQASNEEETKLNHVQFTRGAGTPLYMAPEQWNGEPVGAFTDIYAFGCILHELLVGQFFTKGRTITELQTSHCSGEMRPITENLPENVALLLNKCVALEPKKRCATWHEVIEKIEHIYLQFSELPVARIDETTEDHSQLGWSYNAIGLSYYYMGKVEIAVGYYEKSLALVSEVGDKLGEANARGNLGSAYLALGNAQKTIEYGEQQLAIAREISDRIGEGTALNNIGAAHLILDDPRMCIRYCEEALGIALEVDDHNGQGNAIVNLGNAYFRLNDLQRAIDYYERALLFDQRTRNRRGECADLTSLGSAYLSLGNSQRAILFLEKSLVIAREIGDRRIEGSTMGLLGKVYSALDDDNKAIGYLNQYLTITREVGDHVGEKDALGFLGDAYSRLGDLNHAIEYYALQLAILHEIHDHHGQANVILLLGIMHWNIGEEKKAINYYNQCWIISREIGDQRRESMALGCLGNSYMGLGNANEAVECFRKALALRRELNDTDGIAMNFLDLARAHTQLEDPMNALPLATEALQIWEKTGSPYQRNARELIQMLEIKSKTAQANPPQLTLNAFQNAHSLQGMRAVVEQYPLLKETDFIEVVKEMIGKYPPEDRFAWEQRFAWLREVTES